MFVPRQRYNSAAFLAFLFLGTLSVVYVGRSIAPFALDPGLAYATGMMAIVVVASLLLWPSYPMVILFPLTWAFYSVNIDILHGAPERVTGMLAIAGMIASMARSGVRWARFPRVVWMGLLLLAASYTFSYFFNQTGSYGTENLRGLFLRIVFFYLALFHIRTGKAVRLASVMIIVCGLLTSAVVLLISLRYGFGAWRTSSDIIYDETGRTTAMLMVSSSFLTAPAALLLARYPDVTTHRKRVLVLAGAVFLFAMAFASQFRREILIEGAVLPLLLVASGAAKLRRPALYMAVISSVLFFLYVLPNAVFQQRMDNETDAVVQGEETREVSGLAGIRAFSARPLVGWGPGGYRAAVTSVLGSGYPDRHVYFPFSTWTNLAVEGGVLALGGFMIVIFGCWREARRYQRAAGGPEAWFLRATPALYFLIVSWHTFGSAWDTSLHWFLMGTSLAAVRIARERLRDQESSPQPVLGHAA